MTGASITVEGNRAGTSIAGPADYLALLKPRVMSLVVFTALTGMVLAPGHLHPALAVIALICIAVGAGASGALNMWYDRDIDAVMKRTSGRPLPLGRIEPGDALSLKVYVDTKRARAALPDPAPSTLRLPGIAVDLPLDVEEIGAARTIAFARMLQGVRQNDVKDLIARLEKLKRNLGGADDD